MWGHLVVMSKISMKLNKVAAKLGKKDFRILAVFQGFEKCLRTLS